MMSMCIIDISVHDDITHLRKMAALKIPLWIAWLLMDVDNPLKYPSCNCVSDEDTMYLGYKSMMFYHSPIIVYKPAFSLCVCAYMLVFISPATEEARYI